MRNFVALAGAVVLGSAGTAAQAHHSFGAFDMTKKATVTGTIRVFQWTNPHSYIQLMGKDPAGKVVEYSIEMGAPMYLYARGWRPSTLKPGMKVSVVLNPLRNGKPGGVVIDVMDAAGKSLGTIPK